ncbi:MAG: shikimate dehydrogenase family protein [Nannocystales bacterium]
MLGHPIGHSKSPAMHTAAFEALGLPHRYLAFDVAPDGLADALVGAAALGFGGLNLTVPLKTHALALMDELAPEAEAIGAVNTVCFTEAGTLGRNTDGAGFMEALRPLLDTLPARAVVLGGGGASRAVAHALAESGVQVQWVSRRPGALPGWSGVTALGYDELWAVLGEAELLVNGTTVGMQGGALGFPVPVEVTALPARAVVADLVYPEPTGGLVAQARSRGLRAMDGLPMLWGQGVLALEHWLGVSLHTRARTAMRVSLGLG